MLLVFFLSVTCCRIKWEECVKQKKKAARMGPPDTSDKVELQALQAPRQVSLDIRNRLQAHRHTQ